uniref:Uncharacterized protein n=1 Tax=Daphnia galeata TaxID=27404 RepID=A0A8J2RYI9_9CRUS|nr:unnamed protein product [Daphnia galeata]
MWGEKGEQQQSQSVDATEVILKNPLTDNLNFPQPAAAVVTFLLLTWPQGVCEPGAQMVYILRHHTAVAPGPKKIKSRFRGSSSSYSSRARFSYPLVVNDCKCIDGQVRYPQVRQTSLRLLRKVSMEGRKAKQSVADEEENGENPLDGCTSCPSHSHLKGGNDK